MSLSVDAGDLVDSQYKAAGRGADAGGRAYWLGMFALTETVTERTEVLKALRHALDLAPIESP